MQSIAMHALRLALGSLPEDARSAGVRQLLQALPSQEFQLDLHICSFGGHACMVHPCPNRSSRGCGHATRACSAGGVGSTELSNFLNRHGITTNLLNDNDSMRHVNRQGSATSGSMQGSSLCARPATCTPAVERPCPLVRELIQADAHQRACSAAPSWAPPDTVRPLNGHVVHAPTLPCIQPLRRPAYGSAAVLHPQAHFMAAARQCAHNPIPHCIPHHQAACVWVRAAACSAVPLWGPTGFNGQPLPSRSGATPG